MSTPADPQPAQPYGPMPTIVINNASSASASAAATAGGYGYRRRQSVTVHVLLALFTYGVGNIFYARHISRWNRMRGL
ncbi:hypothetical protein ACFWVP_06030 [Streptomyces sp. NPDC058637]|uniref:hypothetical protein n=1 Tax=Streptomyces sp. NPDC058637 TaxID=3346569 RepID=UPI00366774D5